MNMKETNTYNTQSAWREILSLMPNESQIKDSAIYQTKNFGIGMKTKFI